jgi:hypothetical protein
MSRNCIIVTWVSSKQGNQDLICKDSFPFEGGLANLKRSVLEMTDNICFYLKHNRDFKYLALKTLWNIDMYVKCIASLLPKKRERIKAAHNY